MRLFRRPMVKYRCIHCRTLVRDGDHHDYAACAAASAHLERGALERTLFWLEDRAGVIIALMTVIVAAVLLRGGYPFSAVALLSAAVVSLGYQWDRDDPAGRNG